MPPALGAKTKIPNKNQPVGITIRDVDEPIRAELFSVERMDQHAESLAATQTVTKEAQQGRPLIPRVVENGPCAAGCVPGNRPGDSGGERDHSCG